MKTIIAGSRNLDKPEYVEEAIRECGWEVTGVVSGGARGVDQQGEHYARLNGLPVFLFPAYGGLHGKAAGAIRNRQMAENAEALIAIWDGQSKGTKNMIDIATRKGLKVYIKTIKEQE